MIRDRIKLSSRLLEIANKIDLNFKVSDIGSDHAFIPIYLIKNKLSTHILITDISEGPIDVSKKNIKRFGIKDEVYYKQSDGLEKLNNNELENVIIAGMGGEMIQQILQKNIEKSNKVKRLILQPMKSHDLLRKWLWDNGFIIHEEKLLKDKTKIYIIIVASFNNKKEIYNDYELFTGKYLLKNNDILLKEYLNICIAEINRKMYGYKKSKYDRIEDIKKLQNTIKEIIWVQRSKKL